MNYSKTSKQLFRLLSLTLLVAVTTACSTDDVLLDTPAAARGIPFTATISTDGDYAAGIGGDKDQPCGHIRIMGGTITATGGTAAAGIGGGFNGSFDGVTISNGITRVTAKKGTTADGIYTGQVPLGLGHSDQGSSGSVTIGSQTLTYQQQRNEGGLPTFLRFNVVGFSWDDYSWRTITIAPKNL